MNIYAVVILSTLAVGIVGSNPMKNYIFSDWTPMDEQDEKDVCHIWQSFPEAPQIDRFFEGEKRELPDCKTYLFLYYAQNSGRHCCGLIKTGTSQAHTLVHQYLCKDDIFNKCTLGTFK